MNEQKNNISEEGKTERLGDRWLNALASLSKPPKNKKAIWLIGLLVILGLVLGMTCLFIEKGVFVKVTGALTIVLSMFLFFRISKVAELLKERLVARRSMLDRDSKGNQGEDELERMFWRQRSFYLFIGVAVLAVVVPSLLIGRLISGLAGFIFPISMNALRWEAVLILLILAAKFFIRKYKTGWILFLAWLVVSTLLYTEKPLHVIQYSSIRPIVLVLSVILVMIPIILAAVWFGRRCIQPVGTIESPAQGISVTCERPGEPVGPGWYWCWWPFQRFWDIPMAPITLIFGWDKGIYTRANEKKGLADQPIKVGIAVTLHSPLKDREYRFPEGDWVGKKDKDSEKEWPLISGAELLKQIFLHSPVKDFTDEEATKDELGFFLEALFGGAVRDTLSRMTSEDCRTKKGLIEKRIRSFLYLTPENTLRYVGFPPECVNVEVLSIEFPEEVTKARLLSEIARKKKDAAKLDAEAFNELLAVFCKHKVPPEFAGMFAAAKVKGAEVDIKDLIHMMLLRMLGGGEQITIGSGRKEVKSKIVT